MPEPTPSSPLTKAAFKQFEPSNKDLLDELLAHKESIKGIGQKVDQTIDLQKKTNGRVTKLESDTGPIVTFYQHTRWLWGVMIFAAPVAVSIVSKILDHFWK